MICIYDYLCWKFEWQKNDQKNVKKNVKQKMWGKKCEEKLWSKNTLQYKNDKNKENE